MAEPLQVLIAENFERNLRGIEQFLTASESEQLFGVLLDQLFDTIVPNLSQYARLGADLLARRVASLQSQVRANALAARLKKGEEVREYVSGDYLVLYLLRPAGLILLSIKHHRQLSYDLRSHWLGG